MQGRALLLHFFYLHRQRKRLSVLPQLPLELLAIAHFRGPTPPCGTGEKVVFSSTHLAPIHTHAESIFLALSFPVLVHTNSYLMSSVIICQVHLRGLTLGFQPCWWGILVVYWHNRCAGGTTNHLWFSTLITPNFQCIKYSFYIGGVSPCEEKKKAVNTMLSSESSD